jgi:ABC-type multidrug transport system permease subunit
MDKGKALRTDFQVQAGSTVTLIGVSILSWLSDQWLIWAVILLLLLVIWQFFTGIYIASEFKMMYRGLPPGALLILVTMSILFAAADFTWGLLISLCLFPLILLSNVVLAATDLHRWQASHKVNRWHPHKENILDTEDMFS